MAKLVVLSIGAGLVLMLSGCGQGDRSVGAAAVDAVPPVPALVPDDYRDELDAYHAYVLGQIDLLLVDTRSFVDAVRAGDLELAAARYSPSRYRWELIEPIAGLYPELDSRIDARADDFKDAEADPGFTGWHRLEHAIFARRTLDGMAPVVEGLLADTQALRHEVAALVLQAEDVVAGAGELIEEIASTKVSGEENRYSGTDLSDIAANVEGSRAIVDLFRPRIEAADPLLLSDVDRGFARVEIWLASLRKADGWANYAEVDAAMRNELKGATAALAESLSRLRGTLGID